MMIVEYIQSALLLIAAFLVIVSAVGFISLSKDMKNVVYGRIHIVGIFDIACVHTRRKRQDFVCRVGKQGLYLRLQSLLLGLA